MHISNTVIALILINAATAKLSSHNTCGGKKGHLCSPKLAQGGPCCSSSGHCGSSADYCGTGCQSAFGTCWSPNSTSSTACAHTVLNVGTFTNYANYTFLTTTLPSGLKASNYQVGNPPHTHLFQPSNIVLSPPYLTLTVPGGQTTFPVHSAEITTSVSNILYASVRTVAILSHVPGTCIAAFFYKDDNQEIDIEFITNSSAHANSPSSLPASQKKKYDSWSSAQKARLPLHYTNQPVKKGGTETFAWGPAADEDDVKEHEYRVDWTRGKVEFFLDGVRQMVFRDNVPSMAGSWVWNNWANGDPGWSTGPPLQDSVFKIRSIEMYYNTTDSAGGSGSCK